MKPHKIMPPKLTIADATDQARKVALTNKKGSGSLIALDANGNFHFAWNTEGM